MTAATKRNFEPLDELRYAQTDSAKLSPDGKHIACTVSPQLEVMASGGKKQESPSSIIRAFIYR